MGVRLELRPPADTTGARRYVAVWEHGLHRCERDGDDPLEAFMNLADELGEAFWQERRRSTDRTEIPTTREGANDDEG